MNELPKYSLELVQDAITRLETLFNNYQHKSTEDVENFAKIHDALYSALEHHKNRKSGVMDSVLALLLLLVLGGAAWWIMFQLWFLEV